MNSLLADQRVHVELLDGRLAQVSQRHGADQDVTSRTWPPRMTAMSAMVPAVVLIATFVLLALLIRFAGSRAGRSDRSH